MLQVKGNQDKLWSSAPLACVCLYLLPCQKVSKPCGKGTVIYGWYRYVCHEACAFKAVLPGIGLKISLSWGENIVKAK